ncbi:uncharacterized protein EURHEDRAFT_401268 [Aspergillus ruber CBS 135680]|uniref:F-box domain-containing protein n=1 Tax=Aspergillus ruber (strain CBS 135680) TaxID=1388766 RepID=A0A017SJJ0_ASPRC|nr:uncharacterized protein EURHEDRAFT_401268 [Aspergillus ruber CBS 135680]EYE96844.1 hypothetical protein EURHEDRAFT_401268 [Aspergillus ruber CBS 135680]
MHLPMEIYDHIIFHVQNKDNERFLSWQDDPRNHTLLDSETRRDLEALRLVDKAFCRSASSWLFRRVVARHGSSNSLALEQLVKLSNSPYAACRRLYIDTVISPLRGMRIPNLEELEVHFSLAHDFEHFFPAKISPSWIPVGDILQNLRHFGLYVCENTDRLNQRNGVEPIMLEYATFLNSTHAQHLIRMVELAPNFKSLAINSPNILDLDELDFPPSLRLRSLCLGGVSISSHKLLSLIEQSKKTIRYINFSPVKLKSGTWEQVLVQLCTLPRLLDFRTCNSGYSWRYGLAPQLPPNPHCRLNIETVNPLDRCALGNLQRQVNANRIAAGFPSFTKSDYQYIDQLPLEIAMQYLERYR